MNTQKFKSTHHLKVDALFKKALDKGKLTPNPFTRVDKKIINDNLKNLVA